MDDKNHVSAATPPGTPLQSCRVGQTATIVAAFFR
jgi:hypothetical protein